MINDILKEIWPEWQVEEKPLGKGAYGVVYKGVRREHDVESYAAIKVISIRSDSPEVDSLRSDGLDETATKTYLNALVKDFVSEIRLMESLKGVQNIVSVEDFKVVEKDDGLGWDIYIRMELLTPFNSYQSDRQLSEADVVKLGCDICTALEICGKRNIIHRDIKPDNIFVNDFGYFKLGDFGIARKMENMTGGLSQKGTFNYMAPEVANSRDYDERVDIYSLGIVLYKLLNGNRLPFLDTEKQLLSPSERKAAIERRIKGEVIPPPRDASPEMAAIILKACAFDPNQRFASATEMKYALMNVNAKKEPVMDDRTTKVNSASVGEDTAHQGANKAPDLCDATVSAVNYSATAREDTAAVRQGATEPAEATSSEKTIKVRQAAPLDSTYSPNALFTAAHEDEPSEEDRYLFDTYSAPKKPENTASVHSDDRTEGDCTGKATEYDDYGDSESYYESKSNSFKEFLEGINVRKLLIFGMPPALLLLYVGFYMILIPALYGKVISFFDWIFADVNNIITLLEDANNILVPVYSVVLLLILQYAIIGAFLVSLFFFAKELHNPKAEFSYTVKYTGKEPQFMLNEAIDIVKGNAAIKDRKIVETLTTVVRSMKFSKDFGVSKDTKTLYLENEICELIDLILEEAGSDLPEDIKLLSDDVKVLKQKHNLRESMIKR